MTGFAILLVHTIFFVAVNTIGAYTLLVYRTVGTGIVVISSLTVTAAAIVLLLPRVMKMTLDALNAVVGKMRLMGKYNIAALSPEQNTNG